MPRKSDKKPEDTLETTIRDIHKRFGEESLVRLGNAEYTPVQSIPTGSLSLDIALGVGGVPRGRITEIYGADGAGKSTICQHIIAEAQRLGGTCAYIDMEHALDLQYSYQLGVDIENLMVSQPDSGEVALEIVEALVRSDIISVVVVDSVAALVPRAEIDGDMGDSPMGMQARLMSQALRKIAGPVRNGNTAMIFTNQLRQKIGVVWGNPETTPGGMALKFYATVRMDVRRREMIKSGSDIVGQRVKVRVVKNKVAPPFRTAEFDIIYGRGISKDAEILDFGVKLNILEQRASYYYFNDDKIGQGRLNAISWLAGNPEMARQIEGLIRERSDGLSLLDSEIESEENSF